jgi:hypothetical protein
VPLPGIATPSLGPDAPRRTLYALLPPAGAHPMAGAFVAALGRAARSR